MYRETPNQEILDWWLEQMHSRYQYEALKDESLDRLHNMEFEVDNEFKIFEVGFPHEDAIAQGSLRKQIYEDPGDTREALTQDEKLRLRQAKQDMKHEIYRAKGEKLAERREHRSRILNSVVDALHAVARIAKNLNPF